MSNDTSNLDISTKRALVRLHLLEQEMFELLATLGLLAQHAKGAPLSDLKRLYELLPGVIGAYDADFDTRPRKSVTSRVS